MSGFWDTSGYTSLYAYLCWKIEKGKEIYKEKREILWKFKTNIMQHFTTSQNSFLAGVDSVVIWLSQTNLKYINKNKILSLS